MYVQPFESSVVPPALSPASEMADGAEGLWQGSATGALSGDAIARFVPPGYSGGTLGNLPCQPGAYGSLFGMLQQLLQALQQMLGYGGTGCTPYGNEQYFQSASGGSDGDPHLSFNGNTWNSMVSHPDLLNSNSIPGGFQISTHVTAPNANGVTWNQSASIALNGGNTTISMNAGGQPAITSYGQSIAIADGQTVPLGNGESVTRNQNGSLTVVASNGYGGQITTTLTAQGRGVNVDVSAHDVDLGGALVNGQDGLRPPGAPASGPVEGPIVGQPPVPPVLLPPPYYSEPM